MVKLQRGNACVWLVLLVVNKRETMTCLCEFLKTHLLLFREEDLWLHYEIVTSILKELQRLEATQRSSHELETLVVKHRL